MKLEEIGNLNIYISDGNYSSKYPRSDEFVKSGIPFIRANNFKNHTIVDSELYYITPEKHSLLKKGHLKTGDVLITTRGSIGKTAIVPERHNDSNINAQIVLLRCDSSINNEYLMLIFQSPEVIFQINSSITGTALKQLPVGKLKKIKIPIIPLEDQIRIANILSRAEVLIAQRKEGIQLLDELLKSTFLDMFGDPVRNEKGWEKVKLKELGSIDRGVSKHRPRNAPELLGGKYPLIQTGDVANSGTYITDFYHTYSKLGLMQSKMWEKGTLCITIAANIAKTGILTFDACFPDSVVGFKNFDNSNIYYVHFLFSFFQRILEKNAPQAAQKNINLEILRNLYVPLPAMDLQNQFAQIVEKVESIKTKYQESLQELENLYASLSQKAFKGELDLSKLEVEQERLDIAAEEGVGYGKR